MKKKLMLIACSTVLTAGTLTGCADKGGEAGTNSTPIEGEKLTSIPLPITKEPVTIEYWRANDAKVTASLQNFGGIAAYKKKEELTGIQVKWTHPPLGQQKDQFNLLVATNDMPDVIYYNWYDAVGGPEKMLADGRIIRLNEYIDHYAPNLKKLIESDPDIKKQISLDDGTIYMFPYIRSEGRKLNATAGQIIRKDWLDKLGLKVPTTIDEWYTVLKAFRENDPNGNGKKDELPYTGSSAGSLNRLHEFAPAFGVIGGLQFKDGKVVYGPLQPEYKTFLETMVKWYGEGLIDPEIITNDGKAIDYKITNHLAGTFGAGVFSGIGKYMNLMKDTNPQFNLTGVPQPIGPAGKPYSKDDLDMKVLSYGEAITSSAEEDKIKYIVQWMDFNYSPQGHELFNFGIEGESYTKEGDAVKFTDTILKHPKLTYDQALASYALSVMDGPMNQDGRYLDALMSFPGQKEANEAWMKADDSLALPTYLRFTEDESRIRASVLNPITTYVNEMMTKFVTGKIPLSEYDKFTQTIQSMGIDQVVKIYEDAYARSQKR
ncbi:family 1 extracellular solute-binding protein [Paenibacillus mucilaginosus 3016]|uniref:Family 1 extracellular solute-binding protein n=1 Tax=Paenibacillus mucilaginosus 3016 TaxID=1116391 RepID=H6NJA3_9BACL|nr:extracellular solute-binding protein [Paenibacillus mucilaginosus]AFC29182.1 family 1 extracellular solute-binding protein [Paenibacillus mucilaginosus 3016]WFA17916.1 extracellular solute-binding protein [Paenibacillus mucilaginosus]